MEYVFVILTVVCFSVQFPLALSLETHHKKPVLSGLCKGPKRSSQLNINGAYGLTLYLMTVGFVSFSSMLPVLFKILIVELLVLNGVLLYRI